MAVYVVLTSSASKQTWPLKTFLQLSEEEITPFFYTFKCQEFDGNSESD